MTSSARPLLSVVVPARNSAPWIDELLRSVQRQGVEDMEVLVLDNGSDDETAARVSERALGDPRLRSVRSGATSAAAVRNEGVAGTTGEYLVFADSDDIVPDGAYRAMLAALTASGSDMAIGDHLKFSATETWSPTKRWYPFREARAGVNPAEVPELLSGRPCWNRMFRRSFWDRAALRFPEVLSVEDIEPMTRAFVEAGAIDVVPKCVYLYRDRGDATSLSLRADAEVTVRYLEQELACAELVSGSPVLRRQHAEIVLDADGWAHLHRFLLTDPDSEAMTAVASAARALTAVIPLEGLADVAPIRRALWTLVLQDDWATARSFVLAGTSADATARLQKWIDAVARTLDHDAVAGNALAADGLVPAFVNAADGVDAEWLAERLPAIDGMDLQPSGAVLADAMSAALMASDHDRIPTVSALRHVVPLVVDRVEASGAGLSVGGPADLARLGVGATLLLTGSDGSDVVVSVAPRTGGWDAMIVAEASGAGRLTVSARFDHVAGRFPVVTARMPLPPVDPAFPMQPLADRRDGWRFLIDRRNVSRSSLAGLLSRVARRLR